MAMEKAYIDIENAKREASEKAQLNLAETQGDGPIPLIYLPHGLSAGWVLSLSPYLIPQDTLTSYLYHI